MRAGEKQSLPANLTKVYRTFNIQLALREPSSRPYKGVEGASRHTRRQQSSQKPTTGIIQLQLYTKNRTSVNR